MNSIRTHFADSIQRLHPSLVFARCFLRQVYCRNGRTFGCLERICIATVTIRNSGSQCCIFSLLYLLYVFPKQLHMRISEQNSRYYTNHCTKILQLVSVSSAFRNIECGGPYSPFPIEVRVMQPHTLAWPMFESVRTMRSHR